MYKFIEEAFHELEDCKVTWENDEVTYEFASVCLFLLGAKNDNWCVELADMPEGCRFDTWSTLPTHGFASFGARSRRAEVSHLHAVLQPRFVLKKESRVLSIYYQGFPPLDHSSDRPDWVIIDGKVQVTSVADQIEMTVDSSDQHFCIRYDTLLTPTGPKVLKREGKVTVLSILEASTNKSSSHVENQLNRYFKRYSPRTMLAILGNEVVTSVPVVYLPMDETQNVISVASKSLAVYTALIKSS